jgi:hypothetical protein
MGALLPAHCDSSAVIKVHWCTQGRPQMTGIIAGTWLPKPWIQDAGACCACAYTFCSQRDNSKQTASLLTGKALHRPQSNQHANGGTEHTAQSRAKEHDRRQIVRQPPAIAV